MTLIAESGYEFWNPIIWLITFAVVMVIVYFFRKRGVEKYKKGEDQTKIFLCGEEVPGAEQRQVRGGNVYWGFFETLKEYYDGIVRLHTGIVNDYVVWFVAVMAISAIILLIVKLVG
ncbi:MAG: hydrogenase [Dehalococcoidia bacterium]|nr:hydrogenase [Dehalococcoidia bacterium]RLC65607.1 MAG: hydrogenase [Chloroflexota bacterium]